jgi:dihydroorotase
MLSNTDTVTIIRPDDWHLHLRDGAVLDSVVADTARQFARAIIMPNLKPRIGTAFARLWIEPASRKRCSRL